MSCSELSQAQPVDAAEETDSYTKEETKSTKFINLTHAASMIRQQGQSPLAVPPPLPPPGVQGRLQGVASGTLPRQFSFSQTSESGSSLPQSRGEDGWDTAGPSWVGSPPGSSWLARAASSHAQPSTPPMSGVPVPPSADQQVSFRCPCGCRGSTRTALWKFTCVPNHACSRKPDTGHTVLCLRLLLQCCCSALCCLLFLWLWDLGNEYACRNGLNLVVALPAQRIIYPLFLRHSQ